MYSKIVVLVLLIFASNAYAADYCYSEVVSACSPVGGSVENCNAQYGAANDIVKEMQNYVNLHIDRNWQFLLLSAHFANYQAERPGIASLFKSYSDKLWNDAIDLTQYITKRGGQHDFSYKKTKPTATEVDKYDINEIASFGKALDLWKSVAVEAHYIHGEVTRRRDALHDPEVASFIENKFVHEHASIIRSLAGHTNDLKNLLTSPADSNVSLFMFDNFLKKLSG